MYQSTYVFTYLWLEILESLFLDLSEIPMRMEMVFVFHWKTFVKWNGKLPKKIEGINSSGQWEKYCT